MKSPMRDLIVLLPGIMGGVLQKDRKDVFAFSWGAGWRALISGGDSLRICCFKSALSTPMN